MKLIFLFFSSLICVSTLNALPSLQTGYLKAEIGVNLISDSAVEFPLEFARGFYIGAATGFYLLPTLRTELEMGYRSNKFQKPIPNAKPMSGELSGLSALANLILEFPCGDMFNFSLGSGVGAQKTWKTLLVQGAGVRREGIFEFYNIYWHSSYIVFQILSAMEFRLKQDCYLEFDFRALGGADFDTNYTFCSGIKLYF